MPELKIPPHPSHDFKCHKCKYWLKANRGNYLLTPQGPQPLTVPVTELTIQQHWANMAPCTFGPDWALKSKDHWCWQYASKIES